MALIKCPECGKEVSDKAPVCIHCGFPLEEIVKAKSIDIIVDDMPETQEDENVSEQIIVDETGTAYTLDTDKQDDEKTDGAIDDSSSKWMIWFVVGAIALIIFALVIQNINENKEQQEIANQAITYYIAGEYDKALDVKIDLDKDTLLGDYNQKITLMGEIQKYLNDEDTQLSAIFYYLGNYKIFESEGLIESVYPKIKDAAQKVANSNTDFIYNVEYFADKRYEQFTSFDTTKEKKLNQLLEPLLTEDRELLFEIANRINNEIDYELAEREYEKYKEELAEQAQREYDREHPIQISNEDYTVTRKNGYYYCNGTVHNVSGSTHYYVKVKVTYMDANKDVLTTDWTYAVGSEGIKGGENQQFEIMTKVSGTVEYYRCEILEWD